MVASVTEAIDIVNAIIVDVFSSSCLEPNNRNFVGASEDELQYGPMTRISIITGFFVFFFFFFFFVLRWSTGYATNAIFSSSSSMSMAHKGTSPTGAITTERKSATSTTKKKTTSSSSWSSSSWSSSSSSSSDASSSHGGTSSSSHPSSSSSSSSSFSSSTHPVAHWWDDLAPPFSLENIRDIQNDEKLRAYNRLPPHVTHFCFLIHGHRGLSKDLGYFRAIMEVLAEKEKRKLCEKEEQQEKQEKQEQHEQQDEEEAHSSSQKKHDKNNGGASQRAVGEATDDARRDDGADPTDSPPPPPPPSSAASADFSDDTSTNASEPSTNRNDEKQSSKPPPPPPRQQPQKQQQQQQKRRRYDLRIHATVCNEHKTTDGVIKGGERVVQEMIDTIRRHMEERKRQRRQGGPREGSKAREETSPEVEVEEKNQKPQKEEDQDIQDVTISILGNSLGGIYARYAIMRLAEMLRIDHENTFSSSSSTSSSTSSSSQQQKQPAMMLDGKYRIFFNVFCTTATPHLGISKHTYWPLPRSAEIGVAHAMGDTGKDLFLVNDLIKTMATSPSYLDPLGSFRKRIAFANAYGTDFPVPVGTAAFLSEQSDYPHHFVTKEDGENADTADEISSNEASSSGSDDDDCVVVDNCGLVIATVHTQPNRRTTRIQKKTEKEHGDEHNNGGNEQEADASSSSSSMDDMAQMSQALDSLGWKKVFLDVRDELPIGVSLPSIQTLTSRVVSFRNGAGNGILSSRSNSPSTSEHGKKNDSNSAATPGINQTTNSSAAPTQAHPSSQTSVASSSLSSAAAASSSSSSSSSSTAEQAALQALKQRRVVESRHIKEAISASVPLSASNRLSLPLGHNMIVAFSRNRLATFLNKPGRPLVDSLAKELVEDIFSWTEHDALKETRDVADNREKDLGRIDLP